MNKLKQKACRLPFFEILCLFFIMWSSGTEFNQNYPYAMYGLVISFICIILVGDFVFERRMIGTVFMIIFLDLLSIILNYILYNGEDFLLIQKIFGLLLIVLLYSSNKPYRNVERVDMFINLILFFSVISNVLYIIHVTTGLPMTPTNNGRGEHFFYLQKNVLNQIAGLPVRNSGIYWEPGMYQVFLSFALLFYLFSEKKRFRLIIVIYLILSIVSTFSVSGYVVSVLLVSIFALRNQSKGGLRIVYFMAIVVVLVFIMPYFTESLLMKQDTGSYEARNNDLFFGLKVFARSPIIGFGIGNHEYVDAYLRVFGKERLDSNGMLNIMISMGILGLSLVIYYFFKIVKWLKSFVTPFIILGFTIWFLISINTEPIVFHPFFFFLIGIGVSSVNLKKESLKQG